MGSNKKEIVERIKQELTQTRDNILLLRELTKPIAPDCAIGRISRMDAINNKTINDAALRKAKVKLAGLIAAMDRINDNDFGFCAKCERPIPLGRIMLVPHSRFCANCAD